MKMRWIVLALTLSSLASAKMAPNFQKELMKGGKVSLQESLKPGRVLLLSFWATWCTPCIAELGEIKKHMEAHKDFPLDILAVNVDKAESSSDVAPTVKLYKFDFPIIQDPNHEIFNRYTDNPALPFSVLIDSKGQIRETFTGFKESMFKRIQEIANEKKS